jgi:hypothetical protein
MLIILVVAKKSILSRTRINDKLISLHDNVYFLLYKLNIKLLICELHIECTYKLKLGRLNA